MNPIIRQVIGEAKSDDYETRTYTINARPEHLDDLERLFWWMNSTASGHSGSAKIYVDGDGAARVKIEREGGELCEPEEEIHSRSSGEPEYTACLESQQCKCQGCGHTFDDRVLPEASMGLVRCPKCSRKVDQGGNVSENAVIVKQRPVDYYVCPHCQKEIHEKGTFSEDGGDTMRHRECGGVVEYPETPDDQIADWLRPYVQKSREERKARLAAKATPPPKGFMVGDSTGTKLP